MPPVIATRSTKADPVATVLVLRGKRAQHDALQLALRDACAGTGAHLPGSSGTGASRAYRLPALAGGPKGPFAKSVKSMARMLGLRLVESRREG